MDMISLKCANCGAPLQASASQDTVTCEYCHVQLVIRRPDQPAAVTDEPGGPRGEQRPAAYTQVADVVRSGATIANSAVQVVDKVSTTLFWVKATLIGGLLILVFGCCGIPCYFLYSLLARNEGVQDAISSTSENVREIVDGERSETRATRAAIADAAHRIEIEVKKTGRKLTPEHGQTIAGGVSDGWTRWLRYDDLDGDNFALRSSGVDGRFDTEDDIVEDRSI